MPDLLLELFSEEIPARMQARAAEDLRKLVTDRLVEAGLLYEGAKAFVTPRRLALAIEGIPVKQPDVREDKKGPRVGAPEAAIAGFLRAAGLASINEAKVQPDKKGDFYVAQIAKPGRPAIEILAEIIPQVIRNFPWPKSMRWGEQSRKGTFDSAAFDVDAFDTSSLRWIRPLHSIVATFGPETEQPDIVQFRVDGLTAGDETRGHRFLAPEPFKVRRLADYASKLEKAKVVLDPERRKQIILADANNLAFAQGYELIEDKGLLDEVAGLVEWPVVLMGAFDREFLSIPPEVIRATISNNQKCFVLRQSQTAQLVNKFIIVANIEAEDHGRAIVAGNQRVIGARLADAKFFYETDLRNRLEDRLPKFKDIIFHEKLGTQLDRIERLERLAGKIAPIVGANVETSKRAARLAKADLLTEVVGGFPELQGIVGKYYARAQGEDANVALACEEHYKPAGPNDRVPTNLVSVAVALADKIDLLECFWIINQKPTGSKDPYALRRAALGVVRIVLERNIRIALSELLYWASFPIFGHLYWTYTPRLQAARDIADIAKRLERDDIEEIADRVAGPVKAFDATDEIVPGWESLGRQNTAALLSFFADRLKVQLREQGARHDLVDAVFALEGQDDLVLIVRRVEALGRFLDTEDGKNLLVGFRRAANILRDEEKKDKRTYFGVPNPNLMHDPIERHLWNTIQSTVADAKHHISREDFESAMETLSTLRGAVDAFFDQVTVNVADAQLRENRLKLLNQIREATHAVADFSCIEG